MLNNSVIMAIVSTVSNVQNMYTYISTDNISLCYILCIIVVRV